MKVPKGLISALRKEQIFLLATHINPDGDALGSCLALAEALELLGKKVHIFDRDPVPELYRFMPGHKKCKSTLGNILRKDPLLILLDCNSPERAALEGYTFSKSIVIDHHETESPFGDIRWVERTAAATGLMVFHLIEALNIRITRTMATNIYTAIAVDTGTFRYSNTSPDVLRASAQLIEAGARPGPISEHLYERWTKNRFDLLNLCLGTLEIRNNMALIHVTREMFTKTGTVEADTENFANVPRMIDSVAISALIRETDNGRWKVSMRSKGQANVAKIAAAYGGGGHRNAAGFRIKTDLSSLKTTLFAAGNDVLLKK
ncbi:MAG: bifunctional oligoribonuclease/PAP phosphatase NrnA [Nitrospirae bacterium]|nr:bifunctional oligoribonuclease/PAP phosphatase NrnA [Nitrospirota bacterium]